jgi:hypothetical protein
VGVGQQIAHKPETWLAQLAPARFTALVNGA